MTNDYRHIFTPRVPHGNPWGAPLTEPGRIRVQTATRVTLDPYAWQEIQTDHGPMRVIAAPCGGDCFCDALAIPVEMAPRPLQPEGAGFFRGRLLPR